MAGDEPTMPGSSSSGPALCGAFGDVIPTQSSSSLARSSPGRPALARGDGSVPTYYCKAFSARGEQGGQPVGRQARLVEQQAVHLLEHEAAQVVAGPALLGQGGADRLQAAVAQPGRLPRDVALVNPQQVRDLALAEAV